MNQLRITKEFSFEMAHALHGYNGKCENIHGHTYHLRVTVIGSPESALDHPKNGMVIDFSDLKTIVKNQVIDSFDHALVLCYNDPRIKVFQSLTSKLVLTAYQPTSENLALDFVKRLSKTLPHSIKLHSLRLRETPSSFTEWHASDN